MTSEAPTAHQEQDTHYIYVCIQNEGIWDYMTPTAVHNYPLWHNTQSSHLASRTQVVL